MDRKLHGILWEASGRRWVRENLQFILLQHHDFTPTKANILALLLNGNWHTCGRIEVAVIVTRPVIYAVTVTIQVRFELASDLCEALTKALNTHIRFAVAHSKVREMSLTKRF